MEGLVLAKPIKQCFESWPGLFADGKGAFSTMTGTESSFRTWHYLYTLMIRFGLVKTLLKSWEAVWHQCCVGCEGRLSLAT